MSFQKVLKGYGSVSGVSRAFQKRFEGSQGVLVGFRAFLGVLITFQVVWKGFGAFQHAFRGVSASFRAFQQNFWGV